jgi:lipoate-protein ligase B
MPSVPFDADLAGPAVEVHLLGTIDYGACLKLQELLHQRVGKRQDGQICVLLCEHPRIITVGRGGSAADVRSEAGLIRRREIEVRWVKRGGGTVVHTPGQLAVYPIVPLNWHGFSVGEYLDLLETAMLHTVRQLGYSAERRPGLHGVWGRSGRLAQLGVTVRDWVTLHGAYVSVSPATGLLRLVEPRSVDDRVGSLTAEHGKPVKMTAVRAEVVSQLTAAFGCNRYHLHTGHPLLRRRRAGGF